MSVYLLKIALRNINLNKIFSAINLTGLSFGITCSLIILFKVNGERGIDTFHKNGKSLPAVYERLFFDGDAKPAAVEEKTIDDSVRPLDQFDFLRGEMGSRNTK